MKICDETPDDRDAVDAVTRDAFGGDGEAALVAALRKAGDATISLVAEDSARVVGHVLFSPMSAPLRALALAPVSVAQDMQRRGVGSRLIEAGLARAREDGWEAVFVLGEPDYYRRFGFGAEAAQTFSSPYQGPYFMAIELRPGALAGKSGAVGHAPAFSELG